MSKVLAIIILMSVGQAAAPAQSIFNGTNLDGWVHEGPVASFEAANGVLRTSGRGHTGNWLRTAREFDDFRLRFEYKLEKWAEAAVLLRAPRSARPQHAGLTLVLAHDFHNETTPYVTGAVMGVEPPQFRIKEDETWGRWHSAEVTLKGLMFEAKIDGNTVQRIDMAAHPSLAHRQLRGFVGFPDMGHSYEVRAIHIEELGRRTDLRELLGGKSLEGWATRGASGGWRLSSSVLEGSDGHSILYAPGEFGDFELTTLVRTQERVNAGVFLRGDPEGARRGFEIQIYSPVDAVYPTGSVYGKARSRLQRDLEGQWFQLQVRVEGRKVRVWVDGESVAEFDALPEDAVRPGRIGFQIHSDKGRVEFRDVRVRPI